MLLPWHPDLQIERPGRQVKLHTFLTSPLKRWHPWGYAQALSADRSLRWDAYLTTPFAVTSATRAMRRILIAETNEKDAFCGHEAPMARACWRCKRGYREPNRKKRRHGWSRS